MVNSQKAGNSKNVNWVTLRAEYEAGDPVKKLSERHGISTARIYQVMNKQKWVKRLVKDKEHLKHLKAKVDKGASHTVEGHKTIGAGRSIGQPLGEYGKDRELLERAISVRTEQTEQTEGSEGSENTGQGEGLSYIPDLTKLSAPEQAAILAKAGTEIELMRQHRRVISRASVIAENILVRIHNLVVDGVASDVISFKTAKGEAYHRVPFLGDRESVSDALLKCATTISKLIPLERQAHGLSDAAKEDKLPTIHFNMPNIKVISIDGKGKIVRGGEDIRAPIEGYAQDLSE